MGGYIRDWTVKELIFKWHILKINLIQYHIQKIHKVQQAFLCVSWIYILSLDLRFVRPLSQHVLPPLLLLKFFIVLSREENTRPKVVLVPATNAAQYNCHVKIWIKIVKGRKETYIFHRYYIITKQVVCKVP